jgi:hypothetical protein
MYDNFGLHHEAIRVNQEKKQTPDTTFYPRAPVQLDEAVEEMARVERRTKTAILTLALEQYAERHHPDLYRKYMEVGR